MVIIEKIEGAIERSYEKLGQYLESPTHKCFENHWYRPHVAGVLTF